MKYLKLFENFEDSDNIKDTIEDIFYEFSDLEVNVTKRLNTNDNYRVVVENKIESTLDNDESDLYRHWNYFENKGELNERFIQLFKYMYDEGYSPKVSYSKIVGDGGFVDSPYYIKAVNQFDVIHMGINTPRELYNSFADDERLVKVEIIFYKDDNLYEGALDFFKKNKNTSEPVKKEDINYNDLKNEVEDIFYEFTDLKSNFNLSDIASIFDTDEKLVTINIKPKDFHKEIDENDIEICSFIIDSDFENRFNQFLSYVASLNLIYFITVHMIKTGSLGRVGTYGFIPGELDSWIYDIKHFYITSDTLFTDLKDKRIVNIEIKLKR